MDTAAQQRLRQNLAMADEDALVAIANRGLYRRAVKDLEQNDQLSIEETDSALLVRGPGWCVTMPPEGPAAARDDSGATGITRFVLAAALYLRSHWLDSASTPALVPTSTLESPAARTAEPTSGESSLSAIGQAVDPAIEAAIELLVGASIDDLTRWSGKGTFLQATARLKTITDYKLHKSPTLTIDFSTESTRVLLMTDRPERSLKRLLDQFKTTATKAELAFWVVLSVLVLKREAGEDLSNVNVLESEISHAIREDRLRVAERCLKLLRSATMSGLAHPSTRLIERFETCAVAAEAARFPRLARLLNSIASDIQLQIARSAAADPRRLIDRILMASALSQAATQPHNSERAQFYGRSRSHYVPGGNLQIHGLGAYGWRADSGYEGVTAIFWDQVNQRFLTASQTRGDGQDRSFSLAMAYEAPLGWTNSQSIRAHCRQRLHLEDTKLNWEGRLSSTSACVVANTAATRVEEIDFGKTLAEDWSTVAQRARQSQPMGLRTLSSTDSWLVVKPTQWGNRWFDELEQQFVWDLRDKAGKVLQVRVPWNELEETSIEFLEAIKPEREKLWALVGRVTVNQSRISVYPLSLLSIGSSKGDTVLCPHFDRVRLESRNQSLLDQLRLKHGRSRHVTAMIVDPDDEPLSASLQAIPKAVRDLFLGLEQILSGAIETGAVQMHELAISQLIEGQSLAASLGISVLEQSLASLVQQQQQARATVGSIDSQTKIALANSVLAAAYTNRLAAQAAASLSLEVEC